MESILASFLRVGGADLVPKNLHFDVVNPCTSLLQVFLPFNLIGRVVEWLICGTSLVGETVSRTSPYSFSTVEKLVRMKAPSVIASVLS